MSRSRAQVKAGAAHSRHSAVDGIAEAGAFTFGALIGGAVAAVIMLLNAPRSGAQTRADIRQRGLDLRVQAEHAAAEAREKVQGPDADRLISQAKTAARQFKDENR